MKLMGPDGVVLNPLTVSTAPPIQGQGRVFHPHAGSALWVLYTAVMLIQKMSPPY